MFSDLMQLIVLFFLGVLFFTPIYVSITKNRLYEEWKTIWKEEIEMEKRKLAMQEVNKTRKSSARKQK